METEFGRGFGSRNLFRMVRFADVFPDRGIVSALMTQLGWTHFIYIIAIEDDLEREFFTGPLFPRVKRDQSPAT